MPELPEVETTKQGIEPFITNNAIINDLIVRHSQLRWQVDESLCQDLIGQKIHKLTRRGKYLIFECDYLHFIVHLGMSGSLRITTAAIKPKKHDHIEIILNNDHHITFNDPRRFGCFIVTDLPFAHKLLTKLGPEPLSPHLHAKYLYEKSRHRNITIKQFIMNNEIVVGVGNIYANEVLFLSGIHPLRKTQSISLADSLLLVQNIKKVLRAAIKQGGTTLKDFINAEGKPGYFQQTLRVYGRANTPCFQCGALLTEIRISGRSSVFCEVCQE